MIENAQLLHHRESDPPGSDFRRVRYAEEREVIVRRNGVVNRVLVIVGSVTITILLALTAFFAARDRVRVDSDISRIDGIVTLTTATVAAHTASMRVLEAQREEMKSDIAEIRKTGEDNNTLLIKVLAEVRKPPR